MKKYYLSLFLLVPFSAAQAQWGTPDPAFGTAGIVITDMAGDDEVLSLAMQTDGKVIAAGYCKVAGIQDFAVARYKNNGSLDSTFGTNGRVMMGQSMTNDIAYKVIVQPDGKILLAGQSVTNLIGDEDDFCIMRLLADGSPDPSFGTNGRTTSALSQGGPDYGYDAALQTDGKIVVAGYVTNGLGGDFGVVRYKTNGTLDSTFGTNGIVLTDFNSGADICFSVNIQSDGKIIASGYVYNVDHYEFGAARYNTNGMLDNTFDSDGKIMTHIGTGEDVSTAAAIQPDNKLVLAGYSWTPNMKTHFAIARYNTNGSPDNTFGINGKITTSVDTNMHWGRAVTVQPDGKIILTGQMTIGANFLHHFALIRYNADGTLDNTFGNGGIVITQVSPDFSAPQALLMQNDNKVIAAGTATFNSQSDFALVRYLTGPALGILNFTEGRTELLVYPNPVSAATTLEYTLAEQEHISITIKDVQGRTVATVVSDQLQAKGSHKLPLSLSPSLPAGNYFVILASPKGSTAIQVTK